MAMMRVTSLQRDASRAELALAVGDHGLDDVAAEVAVLRAARAAISTPVSVHQMTWSVHCSMSSA